MSSPLQPENAVFDKTVGRKMRLQRIQHGLTQKALGRKLGVSFQQIQKYEAGINKITAEKLWELSRIFSVSMQYWVDGTEGERAFMELPQRYEAEHSVADDRRAVHVMHYFTQIADEQLRSLLFSFTKALAEKSGASSANLAQS